MNKTAEDKEEPANQANMKDEDEQNSCGNRRKAAENAQSYNERERENELIGEYQLEEVTEMHSNW